MLKRNWSAHVTTVLRTSAALSVLVLGHGCAADIDKRGPIGNSPSVQVADDEDVPEPGLPPLVNPADDPTMAQDPAAPNGGNPFIAIDQKLEAMFADLRAIPNPADRERIRYIDLTTLSNGGMTEAQLDLYRDALSFQLNSLSTALQVVVPQAIDSTRTLYRIDIEDYGWDQNTWLRIEAEYPYAVRYDEDSRVFPVDELTAELVREETGTEIPYVQADWFLATASEAPLYYDILRLPTVLNDLFLQLGVDREREVDEERVMRVGIASSGVALNRNRLTQRFDLPATGGYVWESFDFIENVGRANIFEFPLDFIADGGEIIHSLDNGLQAYSIWTGDGTRVDSAPTFLVTDPTDPQGTVSPQQCHGCHGAGGVIAQTDFLREYVLENAAGGAETEAVLALHPPQAEVDDTLDGDTNRYRDAVARAGVTQDMGAGMNTVFRTYEQAVTLRRAAAILDVPEQELLQALTSNPTGFPAAVAPLRTTGGSIQLGSFEEAFDATVLALGLGEPFNANTNQF